MITRSRHPYRKTAIAIVLVAILLFPVYWMVLTSLRSEADAGHSPPLLAPTHLQGGAYTTAVFENADVKQAIINSTIIALGTMLRHAAAGRAGRVRAGAPAVCGSSRSRC